MTIAHTFNAAELAAYNTAHTTPHRKIVTAQVAESKLPPLPPRKDTRGDAAESAMETAMLHGEDS